MNAAPNVVTRGQRMAQRAFERLSAFSGSKKEYGGFAKRFPSLIHSCGLAQALAFAQAKAPDGYLSDLKTVLDRAGLLEAARKQSVVEYMRLSRETLEAAGWLKRYAEALLDEDAKKGGGDAGV